MHKTSGLAASSHLTTCGKRARTEFTFHVAIFNSVLFLQLEGNEIVVSSFNVRLRICDEVKRVYPWVRRVIL